jgi:hypothetical protein
MRRQGYKAASRARASLQTFRANHQTVRLIRSASRRSIISQNHRGFHIAAISRLLANCKCLLLAATASRIKPGSEPKSDIGKQRSRQTSPKWRSRTTTCNEQPSFRESNNCSSGKAAHLSRSRSVIVLSFFLRASAICSPHSVASSRRPAKWAKGCTSGALLEIGARYSQESCGNPKLRVAA